MTIQDGVGRYDNLHGDEDEVELTWEESNDYIEQEADLLNDQEHTENT